MSSITVSKTLYEEDLNLWLMTTIEQLKAGELTGLDIEHLIEELEGLSGRDKRELESRLEVLLSHLLKRLFVPSTQDYRGWELTIKEQRNRHNRSQARCLCHNRSQARCLCHNRSQARCLCHF